MNSTVRNVILGILLMSIIVALLSFIGIAAANVLKKVKSDIEFNAVSAYIKENPVQAEDPAKAGEVKCVHLRETSGIIWVEFKEEPFMLVSMLDVKAVPKETK